MILALLLVVICGDIVSDAIDEDGNDWTSERQLQVAIVEATSACIEAIVTPPERRPSKHYQTETEVRFPIIEITRDSAFVAGLDPPPVNPI